MTPPSSNRLLEKTLDDFLDDLAQDPSLLSSIHSAPTTQTINARLPPEIQLNYLRAEKNYLSTVNKEARQALKKLQEETHKEQV